MDAVSTAHVMAGPAESGFLSAGARRDFWIFCAATFLAFLTSSTIYYLAVVLASAGMDEKTIGYVLSSAVIPMTLAQLLSGHVLRRFAPLRVAITGQVITLLAFLSLQLTIADPIGASLSRIIGGLGFGLFWPAAMVFAKSKLSGSRSAYLVGIYACMISSPTSLGPGVAEWYFHNFGTARMFPTLALPLIIALLLMVVLRGNDRAPAPGATRQATTYLSMLSARPTLLPNAGLLLVGMIWGFGLSFMALLIDRRGLPAAYFFTSSTITLLVSRFTVARLLTQKMPRDLVVALGFLSMGSACAIIFGGAGSALALVIGGALFGAGHSIIFPTLSVWISGHFPPEQRSKAEGLIGVLLHLGLFGSPLISGYLAASFGLDELVMTIAVTAFLSSVAFTARRWTSAGRE
jgi:MFS family permease